jgi:acylphosphatase
VAAASSEPVRRIGAEVSGRVQGVGFRYFTRDAAFRLLLTGWVRNRGDGGVELEAQGPAGRVDAFLDEIRGGPPLSHVSGVKVFELPGENAETGFEIRF